MKRLIVCCDGTWQRLIQKTPTNVAKLAQALQPADEAGAQQVVYYDSGVGTPFTEADRSWWSRLRSSLRRKRQGAFGGGLEEKIYDAYRFLALNYAPGDEIFLFGFSRGAFTARSLAGLIYNSGLLYRQNLSALAEAYRLYRDRDLWPDSWACEEFRRRNGHEPDIAFLGCWDTVGMLGVPDVLGDSEFDEALNRTHRFHDTTVNRKIIAARHACAIDERRKAFPITPMTASSHRSDDQVVRRWFIGGHGDVGGGEASGEPLSDFALKWLADEARKAGLALDPVVLDARLSPHAMTKLRAPTGFMNKLGFSDRMLQADDTLADLDPSVIVRWKADPAYRPATLARLTAELTAAPRP